MINNDEFIATLKDEEKKALHDKDIVRLYNVLDTLLVLDLDPNKINNIYSRILMLAFEVIEEKIEDKKKIKLDSTINIYYIRAFYEYAIEQWSNDNFAKAKDVLFMILKVTDDPFLENVFLALFISVSKKESLEDFQVNNLDIDKISDESDEKYLFFPTNFKEDIREYISKNSATLNKELDKLEKKLTF
jgi:hypothetical protein